MLLCWVPSSRIVKHQGTHSPETTLQTFCNDVHWDLSDIVHNDNRFQKWVTENPRTFHTLKTVLRPPHENVQSNIEQCDISGNSHMVDSRTLPTTFSAPLF